MSSTTYPQARGWKIRDLTNTEKKVLHTLLRLAKV